MLVAGTHKTNSRDIRGQKQSAREEGNPAKNESGLNVRRASVPSRSRRLARRAIARRATADSPRHSFDASAIAPNQSHIHSLASDSFGFLGLLQLRDQGGQSPSV